VAAVVNGVVAIAAVVRGVVVVGAVETGVVVVSAVSDNNIPSLVNSFASMLSVYFTAFTMYGLFQ